MTGFPRVYWYVLLIVMLETFAMGCFKRSVDSNAFFALGVLFYALVGYLLRTATTTNGIAMTNTLWSGASIVATTAVGILLFKESIQPLDFVAMALILSGAMLIKVTP